MTKSFSRVALRILLLAWMAVAFLTLSGCASMADPNNGDLPWTGRESWELSPNLPGGMLQQ